MSAWFIGNSEHNIDEKGRLIVPTKFRDQLDPDSDGNAFIATPAPEGCVFLYTRGEWRRMCQAQTRLPKGSQELRQFQRRWHGNAEMLALDKQGRIQIPKKLRDAAELTKEIVLAGCYDRIEVWDRNRWNHLQDEGDPDTFMEQVQEFLSNEPSTPDLS